MAMVSSTAPTITSQRSRGGSRLAWIVVGGILTIVSVAWGALSIADLLAHERSHAVITITKPVMVVDVSNSGGSVSIEGTSANEVTIDASLSRGLGKPSHREDVEGDRLVVRANCPPVIASFCHVDYRIAMPAGTDVLVRASRGGITLSSLRGVVDASSSGGGVRAVEMSGPLRLRSTDGSVSATALRSDRVDASSSDGSVRLSFAEPPTDVRASSSDGGVTVEVPDTADAYHVEATSSDGTTLTPVRTDPTSSRRIRATSSDGDVTVRYPRPPG
jgi:hypothetical protein